MNAKMDRLPALPLIANDPYFSIWMPGDTLTSARPVHWSGAPKHMDGHIEIDGKEYVFFGQSSRPVLETKTLRVTPTQTVSVMEAVGAELTVSFWSPALPEDLDALSMPITFMDYSLVSVDGREHAVSLRFFASAALCYDGAAQPPLQGDQFACDALHMAFIGQTRQRVLFDKPRKKEKITRQARPSHCGGRATILAKKESGHRALPDGSPHGRIFLLRCEPSILIPKSFSVSSS